MKIIINNYSCMHIEICFIGFMCKLRQLALPDNRIWMAIKFNLMHLNNMKENWLVGPSKFHALVFSISLVVAFSVRMN